MILQLRDQEIIKAVYSYRLLSRIQIEKLFGFNCTRRVNSRLRKLYDHGYLSRYFLPTVRGSAKAIYYLGPRGTTVVADALGIDLNLVKRKRRANSRLNVLFLSHTLGLNDIRIAFSLGVKNHPIMKLERWINDSDCNQEYRELGPRKDLIKRFRPDGYFRILNKGKLYSFFIEYDRSTMTLGRFEEKVHTYLNFSALGYYQRRFGVKDFRVLVITNTRERLYNLKKKVETVTKKLFRFATLEEITPDTFLDHIWLRAGKEEYFPLIGQ
jgi:hypothetical protein